MVGDFVYNNLGITSVVNRFVVNVALGYIDVNASAGLKNVFKVLCSECGIYRRYGIVALYRCSRCLTQSFCFERVLD